MDKFRQTGRLLTKSNYFGGNQCNVRRKNIESIASGTFYYSNIALELIIKIFILKFHIDKKYCLQTTQSKENLENSN